MSPRPPRSHLPVRGRLGAALAAAIVLAGCGSSGTSSSTSSTVARQFRTQSTMSAALTPLLLKLLALVSGQPARPASASRVETSFRLFALLYQRSMIPRLCGRASPRIPACIAELIVVAGRSTDDSRRSDRERGVAGGGHGRSCRVESHLWPMLNVNGQLFPVTHSPRARSCSERASIDNGAICKAAGARDPRHVPMATPQSIGSVWTRGSADNHKSGRHNPRLKARV